MTANLVKDLVYFCVSSEEERHWEWKICWDLRCRRGDKISGCGIRDCYKVKINGIALWREEEDWPDQTGS